MKVVILAGGLGTRITEESHLKPKPMIEIGGHPLIWHIMKIYSYYGFNEFIICAGYKSHIIKNYFSNYFLYNSDITFDFNKGEEKCTIHNSFSEPWKVTIIDTGLNTMTGGRIKRIKDYINNETFLLTYGDAVSDININDLVSFHKKNNRKLTQTAIQPGGRFGALSFSKENEIISFQEKSKSGGGWINGGFMVVEPDVIDLIKDDNTIFEKYPLETLAREKELMGYKHEGFWFCMDTLREKIELEKLWNSNDTPWKVWNED